LHARLRAVFIGTPDIEGFWIKQGAGDVSADGFWMIKVEDEFAKDYIQPVKG
jgi:hypothetical protein